MYFQFFHYCIASGTRERVLKYAITILVWTSLAVQTIAAMMWALASLGSSSFESFCSAVFWWSCFELWMVGAGTMILVVETNSFSWWWLSWFWRPLRPTPFELVLVSLLWLVKSSSDASRLLVEVLVPCLSRSVSPRPLSLSLSSFFSLFVSYDQRASSNRTAFTLLVTVIKYILTLHI